MPITNTQQTQQFLFKRSLSLAIGQAVAPPATQGFALEYSQLRVRFDIDKNALGMSNKAKIEVYNLSEQSRQVIKKGTAVRIKAGYNGLTETIFLGGVIPNGNSSRREGADLITTMECGDGEASIVLATYDHSYPAQTPLYQILQDISRNMGVNIGIAVGIPNFIYNTGFSANGQISTTLDRLCKTNGLEWHIQNGNLNIIPAGSYTGSSIIVINAGVVQYPEIGITLFDPKAGTGMIGIPSSDGGVLKFTSLLNPKIIPGAVIQMISQNSALNGYYKLIRTHYEGDTHDLNKWQVSCEAVAFTDIVQSLTPNQGFNFLPAVVS